MQCDVTIFGGGVAGLWLLNVLTERGFSAVLLESGELGRGQTIASQGIIHGGLKYTLQGLLTASAANIAEMPGVWRDCLQGRRTPNLTDTRVRAEHCHLWRTDSIASRVGMIGARFGLRVAPQNVRGEERPAVLQHCPGDVARIDEQVISPASLLANLAKGHEARLLKFDAERGLEFRVDRLRGDVVEIRLAPPAAAQSEPLVLQPKSVVFAAGAGNAMLRQRVGLTGEAMQRRPLHMVLVRGALPVLNGHCVDGSKTRVTITSDLDAEGRTIWQVGGQIAEDGVALDEVALIDRAKNELAAAIPRLDLSSAEFSTYRVDRAESNTGGRRPESFQVHRDGNIFTAWPTKLVLAPMLAAAIAREIETVSADRGEVLSLPADWPRPGVASPPWESATAWHSGQLPQRRAA